MLVSWNWLKDYVALQVDPAELEQRLTMAGLNHEGTSRIGDDLAIDLEVTSNRPDCLGHLGVAREISILFQQQLTSPTASPPQGSTPVTDLTRVTLECPELCYRYTARVIRGVRVGPSPNWLSDRLHAIGIGVINNIVDVTNYVCMESGQPLHAFDLQKLAGPEILVRSARTDEKFLAIDHKTYDLDPGMCIIADPNQVVAIGGVMGGAQTEVSDSSVDLLIEAAEFDPVSVRTTARQLNLHSPSSYRFERGIDPEGVNWASRRCCELILDLAGGTLAEGVIDLGREIPERRPIVLRWPQLQRVLGIEIEQETVRRILAELGNQETTVNEQRVEVIPPSWRRDLTREIDLIEEVARIHGYDKIPEDTRVGMAPSHRTDEERVLEIVRRVLTAAGYDEAMTYSVVSEEWSRTFSPWTNSPPLRSRIPMLHGAHLLRNSLLPSLLGARRVNETLSNPIIELFETARIYLPEKGALPREEHMLALTSGKNFYEVQGDLVELVATINPDSELEVKDAQLDLFEPSRCVELWIDGQHAGYLGEVSESGKKQFSLRKPTTLAELRLEILSQIANLKRQHVPQSSYPPISRDLNLVVDESVRWSQIAAATRAVGGPLLEDIRYNETYRDLDKDGPGKKRIFYSVTFRSPDRTLTGEETDEVRQQIENACEKSCGAVLLK